MAAQSNKSPEVDIDFRGVTKRYGEVVAVDNVSLTVERGSFFSFLGPSGCGKTTSLRMIAGFEQPTEGEVFISGEPVVGVPPHKRHVNMVFQHYALFPHMTVAENIGYGLRQRSPKPSKAEMDKQIDETLEMVQMAGFRSRRVWEMSGGQQQRVALARALINKPTVLLLDEPLAALDRKLRRDMQIELQTLQRDVGITFILVTHDQEEALSMSDRICIMRDGHIAQSGSPRELYDHPVNRYVADFVGKTNFIPGNISAINGSSVTIKSENGMEFFASPSTGAPQLSSGIRTIRQPRRVLRTSFESRRSLYSSAGDRRSFRNTVMDVHINPDTHEVYAPGMGYRGKTEVNFVESKIHDHEHKIGFFLVPGFSFIDFSLVLEPLRLANKVLGRDLYSWYLYSADGEPVEASNGIRVDVDGSYVNVDILPSVVVCGCADLQNQYDPKLIANLRRLSSHGTALGAICTGSHILAQAGLLDGYKSTIHWEYADGFSEAYPEVDISSGLFEIDRNRFSCAGGTSALDMMLHIISEQCGDEASSKVADILTHHRIRDGHERQRMALSSRLKVYHPKLLAVIAHMEENLEEPVGAGELAKVVHISTRQLERLFKKYLGQTPTRYYMELRLNRARYLLLQTTLPISEVGLACGFASATNFSRCYKELFRHTPSQERQA